MTRGELTDAQWERLQSLLPPQKVWTGQPAKDHHLIINALLWLDHTGAPWRDLPERYGPWLAASIAGKKLGYGSAFWQRCKSKVMRATTWTGRTITSTAPLCVHISTRLVPKEGIQQEKPWVAARAVSAPNCT